VVAYDSQLLQQSVDHPWQGSLRSLSGKALGQEVLSLRLQERESIPSHVLRDERRRCYKGYASSYAATEPSIGRDAPSTR
jgi:hypothetical protein